MIVYTFTLNIEFPLVIKKEKYLLIHTSKKIKYPHLTIETSLNLEETSILLCKFIEERNNSLEDDLCIKISTEGILITSFTEKDNIRKIDRKISDLAESNFTYIKSLSMKLGK